MTVAVLAVALAAPLGVATPDPSPTAYWKIRGCEHPHRELVARNRIIELTERLELNRRRVWHYAVCVKYRASHLRLSRLVKRRMQWRIANHDRLLFLSMPGWAQQWAYSTGACESGNNPTTNTGNGFLGAFQFIPSTWWAAGGTGLPTDHSWYYQAYIAIRLMLREGTGHWPVCG